jgi:hypothetical protein
VRSVRRQSGTCCSQESGVELSICAVIIPTQASGFASTKSLGRGAGSLPNIYGLPADGLLPPRALSSDTEVECEALKQSKRGVRRSNRDRSYDRRDGWVELNWARDDCEASLGLVRRVINRTKWRAPRGARRSTPKRRLTQPRLLERGFINIRARVSKPVRFARLIFGIFVHQFVTGRNLEQRLIRLATVHSRYRHRLLPSAWIITLFEYIQM